MPSEVAIPLFQTGVTEQQEHLYYEPLPWNTHPIDIAHGSQGWGPFGGPWMPVDFESSKDARTGGSGIDITWFQGDNESAVNYAPSYAVLSLMQDRSIDFVNNGGMPAMVQQAAVQQANASASTSTFSNTDRTQVTGVAPGPKGASGFWASLKGFLS